MAKRQTVARRNVGRVSIYEHHGGWWLYYSDAGKSVRRRIGNCAEQAECEASLINAKLAASAAGVALESVPAFTGLLTSSSAIGGCSETSAFTSTSVADLRQAFITHHRDVLHSALATVSRYSTATLYLEKFAGKQRILNPLVLPVIDFIAYLRSIEVAPNGHAKSVKRRLRDKGVVYILETCRSLYHFGARKGLLPRHIANPFTEIRLGSFRIRDAKPVFVFSQQQELAFLEKARWWAFALHFTLAKTGLRPGELIHALIEDVDFETGWLDVRCKPELGWTTKTNRERRVPLIPEVVAVLGSVVGDRTAGPLFLRERVAERSKLLAGNRAILGRLAVDRVSQQRSELGRALTRQEEAKIFRRIWNEAGAVKIDRVRTSLITSAKAAGLDATCPKSWRHTFATLLQQANVDVLVRQQSLGHQSSSAQSSALGMTGLYTHTTPDFQKNEIDRALRQRPASLLLAMDRLAEQIKGNSPTACVPSLAESQPSTSKTLTRRSQP